MNSLSTFGKTISSLILSTVITCATEQQSDYKGTSSSLSTPKENLLLPIQDQQQESPLQCWFCQNFGQKSGMNESQIKKSEAIEMSIYDVMFLFSLYWMTKD